jgi:myo-inositol-1(or 4)-monophosphatase
MPRRTGVRPGGGPTAGTVETEAELLAAAHRFADLAGAAIRPHFRRRLDVDNKAAGGGFDPVTAADRDAERAIAAALAEAFPSHGLVGEEFGATNLGARRQWVVDPIDGTRAFILGMPLWGTLIGLIDDGAPVLGIMDQPYTRERFWASASGAFARAVDGSVSRLATRPCAGLGEAMLATTHPDMFAAGFESERFAAARREARMTRFGGDCYGYCLLAAGFVDLIIESGLKSYDIVALIPIIERAGGVVTSWSGGSAAAGGRVVASGDPRTHEAALKILAG